ncbi:MAG TPA: hypothetical protein VI699_00270 [Candidatus Acidoferrales bacterium]|nr:hypothetical protein [Candidatus Acidoferrales bacterium]
METHGKAKSAALAFGVGLLSASVLMVELLLTRLFSVILYYHFAFLAVALAMMGLGAGGLIIYLNRHRISAKSLPASYVRLGAAMALGIVLALAVILNLNVPVWAGVQTAMRLVVLFVTASVPFLLAGELLSLLVWQYSATINRIYFYDLVGAALGSLAVLPALSLVGAPNGVLIAALFAALSALLLGWTTGAARKSLLVAATAAAGVLFLLVSNLQGNLLDVKYAKGASTQGEFYARWNAISRVCVHSNEKGYWILIDCDAATEVPALDFWRGDRRALAKQFASTSEDLAHVLRPGGKTLVIGSGGGRDVARALAHGSSRVVAVEINPLIARDLMLDYLREDSRRLFERPEVELVVDDARSAIQRSPEQFDVMQSTLIDTWASTAAGAFALTESYLYTVDAFEQYLRHLTPEGILIVTRWEFVPPRQALRVVSLGRAALERLETKDTAAHFLVIEDGQGELRKTSVLIKRSAFTVPELQGARDFLHANPGVHAVYLPDGTTSNEFAALLNAPDLKKFAAEYPYDVSPVDDSRPFFFFTTRWSQLISAFRANREDLKNNVGLFLLAVSGLAAGVGVIGLLLLPRWLPSGRGASGTSAVRWLYFLAIGVAYIVIEIAFIQRFILFMGHPTYGIVVVVFSILVGSGLGSRWSGRLRSPARAAIMVPIAVAIVVVGMYLIVFPQVLPLAQSFSRMTRGLLAIAVLLPIGFVMGIPFPAGVRSAKAEDREALPWLWSANAGGSVFGSVLAVVLAMTIGIPGTASIGALCYLVAALAAFLASRRNRQPADAIQA